jgi:alcohol dehydrogenase class IV
MQKVLEFNRAAIESKMAMAADYLGISGGFDGFHARVGELNRLFMIPATLTDLGVLNPDIAALTQSALADPSTGGNPITMDLDNTRALLEACF